MPAFEMGLWNAWLIPVAVIAYILGSVPTAYFTTRGIVGKDIRLAGSRNIGAMNAYRLIRAEKSTKLGIVGFALVLVGDMGKGALAIFVAGWLSFLGYAPALAFIIASFFVVLGHNYSLFLKFRHGGRGIASVGGVVLYMNPLSFFIGLGALLASIFLVHYLLVGRINWGRLSEVFSAMGSQIAGRVVGLATAVVAIYFFSPEVFLPVLAGIVLVFVKHVERVKVYVRERGAPRQ